MKTSMNGFYWIETVIQLFLIINSIMILMDNHVNVRMMNIYPTVGWWWYWIETVFQLFLIINSIMVLMDNYVNHVDLTVLSIFEKAVNFDHNLTN